MVCLGALLAAGTCPGGEEPAAPVVEVDWPPVAVIGLPVLVRLVVHGDASVAPARLQGRVNPFLFEMRSDGASYRFPAARFREIPSGRRNYHEPYPATFRLPIQKTRVAAGESCEFVFDLGQVERIPARGGLAPGTYAVEFLEPGFEFLPEREAIRLVEPNAEEGKLIANLASIPAAPPAAPRGRRTAPATGGSAWDALVERSDLALAGVDPARLSRPATRQLQYWLVLARLVGDAAPIGELSLLPADLDGLLPGYRNEVLMLRYEIETARGDVARAEATRAEVLSQRPNAAALLDHIRGRGGAIARHRRAAGREPGPPGGAPGGAGDHAADGLPRNDRPAAPADAG